jgi:hypothetical protein
MDACCLFPPTALFCPAYGYPLLKSGKRREKMKKWLIRGLGLLLKFVVPTLVEHMIVVAFAL